jgi:hypothetical protein
MLFNIFSSRIIPLYPFMNWNRFTNQYAEGLHKQDPEYARMVLLVCAVASTFSNDPRVYQDVRGVPVPGFEYFTKSQSSDEQWKCLKLTSLQTRLVSLVEMLGGPDPRYLSLSYSLLHCIFIVSVIYRQRGCRAALPFVLLRTLALIAKNPALMNSGKE